MVRELSMKFLINIVPLNKAVLCCQCQAISDTANDRCPACGANGSLLSLARLLSPNPGTGQITQLSIERTGVYSGS